jgi:HEAT repeat protein
MGRTEVEVGDPAFDERFWVRGPAPMVLALLDQETRALIHRTMEGGVRLSRSYGRDLPGRVVVVDGLIHAEFEGPSSDPEMVAALPFSLSESVDVLRELSSLARRLEPPAKPFDRIVENLGRETEGGVRARSLAVLRRYFADRPAAQAAFRRAAADEHQEVRLEAALALGHEGRPILAQVATEEWSDDALAARALDALDALGGGLDVERAATVLGHALRTRRLETARRCLDALARRGEAEGVARVARVLAVERGPLAVAAALALGGSARPEAEGPLLAALRHATLEAQAAAAEALGRTGTAAAVPALKEAVESGRRELGRAARQAVAEIQARLVGAAPGQLSLADGQGGQLSLTDGESGRLSLAEAASGPVSLSDQPDRLGPASEPRRAGLRAAKERR